jgi:NDP-sugar pyrophosphorylase family protein
MNIMLVSIILAAGGGTRIRPLSFYIPKILLPVKGRPVLDYLLRNLSSLNISTHYIVASEHLETIEAYLKNTGMNNVKVVRGLSWETGGDLSIALEEINVTGDAAVMNGDIVTDIDMSKLYNHHMKTGKLASVGVLSLNDSSEVKRFGRIELNEDSTVTKFEEKSQENANKPALVNAGFYIFDHRLIERRNEYLVPRKFKLENSLFPQLAREHQLSGYVMEINYWWDVGTIDSYLKAENYMINNHGVVPP